jgi:PIN domain nuclease of toxin-antitoxin system
VIILDTCALIFDALEPNKLTASTQKIIENAYSKSELYCCDISLWEIAMLIQKKRLSPGIDAQPFLNLILDARSISVLEITPAIAMISTSYPFKHKDPADKLIISTALHYQATLVSTDREFIAIDDLKLIK